MNSQHSKIAIGHFQSIEILFFFFFWLGYYLVYRYLFWCFIIWLIIIFWLGLLLLFGFIDILFYFSFEILFILLIHSLFKIDSLPNLSNWNSETSFIDPDENKTELTIWALIFNSRISRVLRLEWTSPIFLGAKAIKLKWLTSAYFLKVIV